MADSDLSHRTIDPFSRDVLEFPAVLALLHGYLSGPISEPLLEQVEPHTQLEKIRRDLELAGEAREYLRESSRPSLAGVCEPSALLEKLRVEGLALTAPEILALVEVARAGLDMYRTFAKPSAPHAAQHKGVWGPNGSRFLRNAFWRRGPNAVRLVQNRAVGKMAERRSALRHRRPYRRSRRRPCLAFRNWRARCRISAAW